MELERDSSHAIDEATKRILLAVVGTQNKLFCDGLLYDDTIASLATLWNRLDYVHNGVLQEKDFKSARGLDPIWSSLLSSCDINGDGNVSQTEFCVGFVLGALAKPMVVNGSATMKQPNVTGFDVMRDLVGVLNEHVMQEIAIVNKKMGYT